MHLKMCCTMKQVGKVTRKGRKVKELLGCAGSLGFPSPEGGPRERVKSQRHSPTHRGHASSFPRSSPARCAPDQLRGARI